MTLATLLAIEDNPTHQYVVRRFCEMFEYDVHIVASAEEGFAAFGMANYAAILLDLSLPGMNGYELARMIRAEEQMRGTPKGIPIIALTASKEPEDRQACFQAGIDDYLSKPFNPEDLRKVLLRWVYQPSRPNLKILKGTDFGGENHQLLWEESG
jgi:CheY-like chemotaxis protein